MRWSIQQAVLVVAAILYLAGCSSHRETHHGFKAAKLDPFAGAGSPYYRGSGPIPFGGGRYQVGNAYQVAGRTFTPHEQPDYDISGLASWYGEAFHRRKTSNGEWFDMNTLTAAHATLPLPSYALVTNLENDRQVVVRINDRGPFVDTRVIDVSKKAADVLGYRQKGIAHVRVQLLGIAPLNDHGSHLMAMNQALGNGASMQQLASLANNPSARSNVQVAAVSVKRKKAFSEPLQQASFEAPPQQFEPSAGYIVRVAVFHSLDNAQTVYQTLANVAPTQIIKAVGANGPLYRVQMGPIDNMDDAQTALETAMANGFEDARIIKTQITQVSSN